MTQLKSMKSFLCVGLFVMTIVCLMPTALQAQFRASLRGTVSDPSGAVVPGATVTLTNPATNQVQVSTTDGSGIYTFNALPGETTFSLKVEHPGFTSKEIASVVLIPEQANALNVVLVIGEVTQTVTVSGSSAPLLDTDTATVSATISSNEIQHMPSMDRDIFQLAQLTPGVYGDGAQTTGGTFNNPGNQGPGGSGGGGIFATENGVQIQARGGQYETNGISIDGISTVSAVWGGASVITPSEDSVDSFKIVSNSYDAENGRFSGAQMEITSKGGSNQVHGSAFFKASRPGLNAYQRWNGTGSDIVGTPAEKGVNRNDERQNNYGGSLGGPFWKNKLFGFFNYEASPTSSTGSAQGWYETPSFLANAATPGSIAAQYLSYPGEGVAPGSTLIARTCGDAGLQEGVNCNTEAGGLDVGSPITTGLGLQDLTYGGNSSTPGVGSGLDGIPDLAFYNTETPSSTAQKQYNGRLDADVTSKDRLTFTIYWVPVSSTFYNGPQRAANLWHHTQTNDAFSLIWNHTFSPTLLNQARANAAGWRWNEVTSNPQEPFGLPQDNINNLGSASPSFYGPPGPSNFNQWTYDYNDIVTKIWGRHSLKAGGDLTRLYYLNNPTYNARPSFNFNNLWDFANDAPYFESGQFASATGTPFANRQDMRSNMWAAFVQDDYKIRPNLTINLGLRWSYFGGLYAKQNNLDVVQFGAGGDQLTGLNVRVGGNLYQPQKNNFGPQLGFAWQPLQSNSRLVVRGGFGIFYNQNEFAIIAQGVGNPPNAISAQFTCPYPYNTNPSCAGNGILYNTAPDIHSIFGYPPNPATITTFGSNNLPLTGTTAVWGYNAHPKTISNYHYSADVQYELPHEWVASLGYIGSQSRHLLIQENWNTLAAQYGQAVNPVVNQFYFYDNAGSGNYNGGTAELKHRFSYNFNLDAMYTFSKAMDNNSGPYEEDPYPYDPKAAYGRSDYNVANAFKLFGLWQPVFFHGERGWLEKVAGDWSVSGIWNVHTGFPWNPTYGTNGFYYQGAYYNLRPTEYTQGPCRLSTSNAAYQSSPSPGFNGDASTCFKAPTYIQGPAFPATTPGPQPGIHRNFLTGPGYSDLDASLTKGFGFPKMAVLGEAARLEFRADAYNLFNKTNINTGSIDTYIGGVQPDGTVSPNSHFGVAGGALGSRTVQLQARFSF